MESKKIGDQTAYHLGNGFYAIQDDLNGLRIAYIVLPSNLDHLIDNVNRERAGAIPDRDQFIVGLVVSKAIITPKDKENEYIGAGMVSGVRLHFYLTANGAYIGGSVSKDRTYVMLIPAPDPNNKK